VLFPELKWEEAFLLAAVLTPTDPVVTSSVVGAPGVPAVVRHTLNLESGLNDGLALPFVLCFLVLAAHSGDAGSEAATLFAEAGVGAVIGAGLGYLGGSRTNVSRGGGIMHRYEGIWAVGPGLSAFGLAGVTFGNGLIAAFVASVALGISCHEAPQGFVDLSESVSAVFQVLTFVFGALIVGTGYDGSVWALAAFIPSCCWSRDRQRCSCLLPAPVYPARRSSSWPGSALRASPRCCSRSSCSSPARPIARSYSTRPRS